MASLEDLQSAAAKAKAAFQEKHTDARKDAHRAAAQEYSDARSAERQKREALLADKD